MAKAILLAGIILVATVILATYVGSKFTPPEDSIFFNCAIHGNEVCGK